jgi:hypothetical protein
MERVQQILDRIAAAADLSDEDLSALETETKALYGELRDGEVDAEVLEALTKLADGLDAIGDQQDTREHERQEMADKVAALDKRVEGGDEPPADEKKPDEGDKTDKGDDDTKDPEWPEGHPPGQTGDEGDEEHADEQQEALVAAGARTPARVRVPRQNRPVDTEGDGFGLRMLAAPDLPSRPAGSPFKDWDEAAAAMCARLGTFRGEYHGEPQNIRVGTLEWERPPELVLGKELAPNIERIRQVTAPTAVVASGGICGPVAVRYGVFAETTAARPVRDSLPGFTADRGGIMYQSPVGIGDVDPSAVGSLTAATDALGTHTKTIWCIPCSPTQTVLVDAIYQRLCFSNFQDRYNPENMRAYQDIARAAWARYAERRLLASMRALTTDATAPPRTVNSLRTFIYNAGYLRAWYSDRYRLPDAIGIVAYAPRWVLELMTVDMTWQAPGDDTLRFTDAAVQAAVAAHGIRIVWTLESDVADEDLTGVATPDFELPASFHLLAFPEGGFTFLDGGTLDFGIVRDSATNAKNRFETFFESFEGVAKTGYQGFNVEMPLCMNGAAAALATQACANTGGGA